MPTDPFIRYEVLLAHAVETGLEHDHQAAFVAWTDLLVVIGAVSDLRWGHAVGNGGLRHPIVAADLRLEGVRSGVPDWLLFVRRGGYFGLVLEFKAPTATVARVTPEQRAWLRHFRAVDCATYVVFGVHAAQHVTREYFSLPPEPPFCAAGAPMLRLQREAEFDAWRPEPPPRLVVTRPKQTGRSTGGPPCVV